MVEKEKIEINTLKLWIILGFAWITPQLILVYLPENYQWIKYLILIIFGYIIVSTNIIQRWLIK